MTEPGTEPTTPTVKPPLWRRPWFIVLAVLALLIIIGIAASGGGEPDSASETTVAQSVETSAAATATTAEATDTTTPGAATTVSESATASETTAAAETTVATPETTAVATSTPVADDTLAVGDTATSGDVSFTMNEVTIVEGNEAFSPEEGNVWIAIEATIENNGNDVYASSTIIDMELRDTEGVAYDQAIFADLSGSLDGEVQPGRQLRGQVAFEVPEDASQLEFFWSADAFGGDVAIFSIPDPSSLS